MRFLSAWVFFTLVCFSGLYAGAVYTVSPDMSTGDIQKQINGAKENDVVRFSKGVYKLSESLNISQSVMLEGVAGDSSAVVLKVAGNYRHIKVTAGKVDIKNMTFEGSGENASGGGIEYLGQDSLILRNCELRYNKNQEGGAIYAFGNVLLKNCLLSFNAAVSNGGALYSKGKAVLIACFLNGNKAVNMGGAIFNQARSETRVEPVGLTEVIFASNSAEQGGAVYADNPVEIGSCVFVENTAGSIGGGAVFTTGTADVGGSTFCNNSSKSKGGGLLAQHLIKITDCVFSGNHADEKGGGIYSASSAESVAEEVSIIRSSEFSKNESGGGGGIYSSFSMIVLDSYFDRNDSKGSGGGIFCDKSLLLNRTCFDSNTALSEGGAVDAGISRIINTTMFNNNAQNAGALHTFESSAIVLSTFAGNEATLKSGSVIYGKNVVLFGNIIAGNKQDKISGKIKTDENNVVGSSIKDIFQNIDGGGSVSLSRMPGIVPALMIKNAGPASGKITAGKLDNWERILGITDFFNVDQWRNARSPDASTDAGAVLYTSENLSGGESQIPVVDISGLISDVHSRKIPKGIHDLAAAAVQKTQPVSSSGKSETSGKTPAVVSPKVSQSSFDEDLDRIIEAILAGEPFDVDDVADVVPARNIDPSKSGSKDTKNTKNPEKPADTSPGNDGKNEPQPVTAPVKTSGQNKNNPADALVEANVPLSGVYTINPTNSTGGRNFSSIEEAVNRLNSYGTAQATRFVIAQGTYITEKPLTISNAQHPIVFSADENGAGKTIIRSNGNNRSIVVAVATSVTMEGLVFEGPSGENADGKNIQNGGGISCNTESVLTFVDCIFRYNKNQTGSGVFAKKVLISRCAFYDNVASDGAGIYVGECTAVNSTFYGNKTGVGGGIYAKEKATVVFCTFTQNEAGGRGAAISASNIYLYGSIVSGNKSSGSKEKDVDGILQANYSNILGGLTFNVFAETDTKGVVKLDFNMGTTPVATVKPSGMAAEQISESLFKQWEDELNLEHLLSVDQNGKRRPQNRNAEIGAWEIPDKRAN